MKRIALFTLLTACGTAETTPIVATTPKEDGAIERQPNDPKAVTVEYRKDGSQIAIALDDTADLPSCTNENARQLAWIKKTEQFFACEDQTWVEVQVKGKAGDAGTQGAKGDKGDKGEPGKPPAPNEWVDPITGERWLFALSQVLEQMETNKANICTGIWQMPSTAQGSLAMLHGMGAAGSALGFSAGFQIWTHEIYSDAATGAVYGRYAVTAAGASIPRSAGELTAAKTAVAVCIAKGEVK